MKKPYFLDCFHLAYEKIPAYKSYLTEHKIDPSTIVNLKEFQKLPLIDKKSYILNYPVNMLFSEGKIPALGHSSSGSSGTPTLWFRGPKQRKIGAKMHSQIFTKIFNIKKEEPTVVLICFAMGMWVAGSYTLMACHEISRRGNQVTTFPVGMDLEGISAILKKSASFFKNVIIIGYPFFLDIVFEEMLKQKTLMPKNIFIVASGDKFSEDWRRNTLKKISQPIEQAKRIINIYGCSDAGALGHETPLSISIRQKTLKNAMLYKEIFGDSDPSVLPTLVQYNPRHTFFEEKEGELLLTADLDCPLIRYNMHDKGKVISFSKMKKILISFQCQELVEEMTNTIWKFPFLTVDSKTDVAVIFEAVKIYPEQIKVALSDQKIFRFLSGSFITYTKKNLKNENRLYFDLEVALGINEISDAIKQEILDCLVNHLKISNSEFRNSMAILPHLTIPILSFHLYGSDQFKATTVKDHSNSAMVNLVGKKARVLV